MAPRCTVVQIALAVASIQTVLAESSLRGGQPWSPAKFTCLVAPEGDAHHGVAGIFEFEEIKTDEHTTLTNIRFEVGGLNAHQKHGVHIHEKADFSNGCLSTGNHFNPFGFNHGDNHFKFKHLGDLGNILANASGVAVGTNLISDVPLSGANSILGRSIVVHELEDDLGLGGDDASRAAAGGNAGGRKFCGKIVEYSMTTTTSPPPVCPHSCREPLCVSGFAPFHGWKRTEHGVCTYSCSRPTSRGVRHCGDGAPFTTHGSIDCTGCRTPRLL